MSDIMKTIGSRVRIFRRKAGLTQEALGALANLHSTYIGQIERAESNISIEAVDKLIRAMSIRYEDFFANISDGEAQNVIATECYDLINSMTEKQQRDILDIIKKVMTFNN